MGYSLRNYAACEGRVYRIPANKVAQNQPALPELAGKVIKYVEVAFRNKNRVPQKIIKVFIGQYLVLENGSIDFSLQKEDLRQIESYIFGGPAISRKVFLWNRKESQALINLMKEDLGDEVVFSIPDSYLMELGIQPPSIPFRVIKGRRKGGT